MLIYHNSSIQLPVFISNCTFEVGWGLLETPRNSLNLAKKMASVFHKELERNVQVGGQAIARPFLMAFIIKLLLEIFIHVLWSAFISKVFRSYTITWMFIFLHKTKDMYKLQSTIYYVILLQDHHIMSPFQQSIDVLLLLFHKGNLATILKTTSYIRTSKAIFQPPCLPCQHSLQFLNNI